MSNLQILALNGTPVRNLKQLANMVENCDEKFLRFDLEHQQVKDSVELSFTLSCSTNIVIVT